MIDPFYIHGVSILVFVIAVLGVVLNLDNIIKVFLSIELMFLAVSINFIAYAYGLKNVEGHVFAIILLTVAAAESAVGLGLLVFYFRQRATVSATDINSLKE